ncbi:MAG: hypothetical protein ACRERC_07575 [Candidatus Binatia bacterium]
MPKSHQPYTRELKARLIEMVRAGRTPEELAVDLVNISQLLGLLTLVTPRVTCGRDQAMDSQGAEGIL